MKRQLILGTLSIFLSAAMVWHLPASAQVDNWPAKKPIRLIVHFAPGGVLDIITRALSGPLALELGQAVLVENKSGAGGNIGTDFVAKSAPDGYTALMYADSNTIAPALYSKLNHDPLRDFDPVTMLAVGSHVLVANQSAPVRSLTELIDYAKKIQENFPMQHRATARLSISVARHSKRRPELILHTCLTKAVARRSWMWLAGRFHLVCWDLRLLCRTFARVGLTR